MKIWKKILNESGMGIAQAMVMVGILGTMTGVFIREADLINRQTGGLVMKTRTDQAVTQIKNLLSNTSIWIYPGNPAAGQFTTTLYDAVDGANGPIQPELINYLNTNLNIPGVTISLANSSYTTMNFCEGLGLGPGGEYETCDEGGGIILHPGESRLRFDFEITRGKGNQLISATVIRSIFMRGRTQDVGPIYPEDSEAYYAAEFCNSIGGIREDSGRCNNRFREKACIMMGGEWIRHNGSADSASCLASGGVWDAATLNCNQCAKQETLCAWLTDDPNQAGYQRCWNDTLNSCSFPTVGAPVYTGMPWSRCGSGGNAGARRRLQTCIKGNCEGLCSTSSTSPDYPIEQIVDTGSTGTGSTPAFCVNADCNGATPGVGSIITPRPYNPVDRRDSTIYTNPVGPAFNYTVASVDTDDPMLPPPPGPDSSSAPPTCQQYGRYNATGPVICDGSGAATGLAGACYRDATCGNSYGFTSHACNPSAWPTAGSVNDTGDYRNQTATTAQVLSAYGSCGPVGTWVIDASTRGCGDQNSCTENVQAICNLGACGAPCPITGYESKTLTGQTFSCERFNQIDGTPTTGAAGERINCNRTGANNSTNPNTCRVDAAIAAITPASPTAANCSSCGITFSSTCNTAAKCGGAAPSGSGWSPTCTDVSHETQAMSRTQANHPVCDINGSWNEPATYSPDPACSITPGTAATTVTQTATLSCSASCNGTCGDPSDTDCDTAGSCSRDVSCECVPNTCANLTSLTDAYCPGSFQLVDDGCGGTVSCEGTKSSGCSTCTPCTNCCSGSTCGGGGTCTGSTSGVETLYPLNPGSVCTAGSCGTLDSVQASCNADIDTSIRDDGCYQATCGTGCAVYYRTYGTLGDCTCPCTPSCPATNTYCAGSEPDNGCGSPCPTGTKSSGCSAGSPTIVCTLPGCHLGDPFTVYCYSDNTASALAETGSCTDETGPNPNGICFLSCDQPPWKI
jgi:hypothetical protein